MITARGIGVLEEIAMRPSHGGAPGLSQIFGEGREAIQNTITLLKKEGLLETITNRMGNGKTVSTLRITQAGYQLLETRIHTLQSQLNSSYIHITNSISSKPNSERGSREVNVEYFESEDDRLEAQRKWREKKHAEKMEVHESRRQEKMLRRNPANASGWSPTDSAFEFAEQMHNLWHIQPWQVTRSRFRYALADKRKEYNTDGALELQMMALFFSQIKHDTKLNDPEIVWKRFILQFHNLLTEVQRSRVTPEKMEAIKEKSTRSLDWMNDV